VEPPEELIDITLSGADGAKRDNFSVVFLGDRSDSNGLFVHIQSDAKRARLVHGWPPSSCVCFGIIWLWLTASEPTVEPEVSLSSRKSLCLGPKAVLRQNKDFFLSIPSCLREVEKCHLYRVQAEQTRRHAQQATCDTALRLAHHGEDAIFVRRLQQVLAASAPLDDILARAVASLRSHRDVMESDVAQSVWGCHDCGYLVETEGPDTCPHCGALGAEFEWFGPFYSAVPSAWRVAVAAAGGSGVE
jgi:hypothetical protein